MILLSLTILLHMLNMQGKDYLLIFFKSLNKQ